MITEDLNESSGRMQEKLLSLNSLLIFHCCSSIVFSKYIIDHY